MRHQVIENLVTEHIPEKAYAEQWDTEGLKEAVALNMGLDLPIDAWAAEEGIADQEIRERLLAEADRVMAQKVTQSGTELMRQVEKAVLLQTLDHHWREHLMMLDYLRQAVGLRGYAQRDPLNEYKSEAFELFESLLSRLRVDVTRQLMNAQFVQEAPKLEETPLPQMHAHHIDPSTGVDEIGGAEPAPTGKPVRNNPGVTASPNDPSTWGKVARNAECPCGSGKKFKHCHGAFV
jgi:preprotein translocase subunit SecA